MRGLIIFENGMEDSEGVSSKALLTRGAIRVDTVTTEPKKIIKTSYGLKIHVDYHVDEINLEDYDFLIVPGGPYIAKIYNKETRLNEVVKHFYDHDKMIGALCAAPRWIGHMGLLKGKDFTCYPGCENDVLEGNFKPGAKVVKDGNFITGRSPAYVIEFIYEIVETLLDQKIANAILDHLAIIG